MSKNSLVDEFIGKCPKEVQLRLRELRTFINSKIPGGEETVGYGVPAFKLNGKYVIYFSGYKNHIGIYPAPREEKEFKEELKNYKGGKGTVQFPNSEPIPFDLVERIIEFRLKQNSSK